METKSCKEIPNKMRIFASIQEKSFVLYDNVCLMQKKNFLHELTRMKE